MEIVDPHLAEAPARRGVYSKCDAGNSSQRPGSSLEFLIADIYPDKLRAEVTDTSSSIESLLFWQHCLV